jgi:hypothetical protein
LWCPISRAQQGQVFSTASGESATNEAAAQASEKAEQGDIESQQSQLAKFSANNPYVQGGQEQTLSNQQLSNTADATANAAKADNQQLAQRTGQNAAIGVAAGEEEQQQAQRTLGGQESSATQNRIGNEAGYNETALNAGNQIVGEQNQLANTEAGQAQGELGSEETAAQTPSFLDELGQGLIQGGEMAGGIATKAAMGCWIAAELWGGWDNPRTILVRMWIFGPFRDSWIGRRLANLYIGFGEDVARWMKTNRLLRWVMRKIFDAALEKAIKWEARG